MNEAETRAELIDAKLKVFNVKLTENNNVMILFHLDFLFDAYLILKLKL